MRICECEIENFGKLKNFTQSFSPSLTSICRENGWGKTTLSAFIFAMFYGLDDTRRAKLSENTRKHYLPWNGEACRGSLVFELGEKKYRIEREFSQKAQNDLFRLYDLKTGRESFDFSENIGKEIFEVDADGFLRTLFLSEENLSGKNENKSIAAKLSNLTGSEADLGELDRALKLLDEERKIYFKKGGGGQIGEICEKISILKRNLIELEAKKQEHKEKLSEHKSTLDALRLLKERRKRAEIENEKKSREKIQRLHEQEYRKKYEKFAALTEKKAEYTSFFKAQVPTRVEIDELIFKSREEKRLAMQLGVNNQEPSFFKPDARIKVSTLISDINGIADKIKSKSDELSEKESQRAHIFRSTPPSQSEIPNLQGELKRKRLQKKRANIYTASAVFFLLLGAGLSFINTFYLFISLLCLPLLFIARRVNLSALKFFIRYAPKSSRRPLASYYETERAFLDFLELSRECDRLYLEKQDLLSRSDEYSEAARSLLLENAMAFDENGVLSSLRALEQALLQKEAQSSVYRVQNEAAEKRLAALRLEISSFISRYPCENRETALIDIKDKLYEYENLTAELLRLMDEIEIYKISHGIDVSRALSEENVEINDTHTDVAELLSEISALERAEALKLREISELEEELMLEGEYLSRLEALEEELSKKQYAYKTVELAKKFLSDAGQSLSERYLGRARTSFLHYVSLISGQNDGREDIDTSFAVTRREGAVTKESEAYSRGVRELYALAVRLALIDALYEKEKPFLVLDDPFAYFDDEKLSRSMKLIKEISKKQQVIYLTCTEARA
jgi:uncharacterized protein YhaN